MINKYVYIITVHYRTAWIEYFKNNKSWREELVVGLVQWHSLTEPLPANIYMNTDEWKESLQTWRHEDMINHCSYFMTSFIAA